MNTNGRNPNSKNRNTSVYAAQKIGQAQLADAEREIFLENKIKLSSLIYPIYKKSAHEIVFTTLNYLVEDKKYYQKTSNLLSEVVLINAICLERILKLDLFEFSRYPFKLVTADESPAYDKLKHGRLISRKSPIFCATEVTHVIEALKNNINETIVQLANFAPYYKQMEGVKVNHLGFIIPEEKQANFKEADLEDIAVKAKQVYSQLQDLRNKLLSGDLNKTTITIKDKDGVKYKKEISYPEIMLMLIQHGRLNKNYSSVEPHVRPF